MVKVVFYVVAAPLDARRKAWVSGVYDNIKALALRLASYYGFNAIIASPVTSSNYLPEPMEDVDGVIVIVLSGGTDRMIYNIVSNLRKPTLIYSHPGENSLASAREAIAALRELGFNVSIFYGELDEIEYKIKSWLSAVKALGSLRESKLGLIGTPEPWLLNVRDAETVKSRFSVEIVSIDWDEMFRKALGIDNSLVESKVKELKKLFPVIEVRDEDLEKAVRIYYGLRGIVKTYKLDALAVEARDMFVEDLRDYGPYLAVALLSSEGVPADYEVDVEAILTKLLVYKVTGKSSFMANLTRIDEKENTITLSHCTVPIDMIDTTKSRLTTYFETGRTVAIRGKMKEGERVTILRLGGAKLNKILAAKGTIVNGDLGDPNLCRTQIIVKIEGSPYKLVEESIGNHMIVTYGDIMGEIELFATISQINLIKV